MEQENKQMSEFERAVKIELEVACNRNEEHVEKSFKRIARELLTLAEQEIYKKRLTPIYNNRTEFEQALDAAWESYKNGYMIVDGFEDDFHECIFAKGFREGYLLGIKQK